MTWPFENDTSGIVKRISNRSISANRKRNIFIVLTIVLASALLSAIVLYGFGVMQETQNRNQKTAQIMYHAISEQQGQELYKQEEIAWVGEFFNAFSEQVNHSTVNFTYANADTGRLPSPFRCRRAFRSRRRTRPFRSCRTRCRSSSSCVKFSATCSIKKRLMASTFSTCVL